ncbi:MAG: YscQ/HrcQ family type III secretion apparatus protein [Salinarimonadaceae bacterium]|nr:MAG: YscQ/HrcQ family type III secretion apparatus protein [Salinarimonadaceae bacterium]
MNAPFRLADPATATPLELPAIGEAALREARRMGKRRAPFMLSTGAGDVAATIVGREALSEWSGAWMRLDLLCSDRPATLWLPQDVALASLRGTYPDLDDSGLDPADRGLLLDVVENDLIDRLSRAARSEIVVVAARPVETIDAAPDFVFSLRPRDSGDSIPAALVCHEVEREMIARAVLATPVERSPFPGLTVEVAFRCGYSILSLAELAELEVGCGIALDDTTLNFQKIVAVVAERFAQTCSWQTIKPTLDGPLLNPVDRSALYYTTDALVKDEIERAKPGGPQTGGVDEVPVQLIFELGRAEAQVAELESLQSGYVFDLGKPLSQTVDILANGRRIGSGELVRLGETIGVRVSRLVR